MCTFLYDFICVEKRLHAMNQLSDHPTSVEYFWPDRPVSRIDDDHVPFLSRGVTLTVWYRAREERPVCSPFFFFPLTVLPSRSGRCSNPPPHSHPLSFRVAHVWRQRAEPGSLLHWEPQQDPAGLRPGIPQCPAQRANKSADIALDSSTQQAEWKFNISKRSSLLT